MPRPTVDVDAPKRHVDSGTFPDWMAVTAGDVVLVVDYAGEGVTVYELDGATKNPRVMASADAVLWEGIVGTTHYEDKLIGIQHHVAGIKEWLAPTEWLDEAVPLLKRTTHVKLKGVGGRVEFDCIDCGEHIERERHKMDIPGMTPQRCTSCTFDRMAE